MSRTFLALVLLLPSLLGAVPAAAQTSPAPGNVVTPTPPPREGTVGPEQLRDFSLPGTRPAPTERPAAEPPRPATPAPATDAAPPANATTRRPPAPADAPAARPSAPTTARDQRPQPTSPAAEPLPAPGLSEPDPAERIAPLDAAPALPLPELGEPPLTAPETDMGSAGATLLPTWWPWLLAAIAAGIALALLLRQRRRPAFAGYRQSGDLDEEAPSPPAPAPVARAPAAPAPAADPPLPQGLVTTRLASARAPTRTPSPAPLPAGGVVSRRLRGWIEVELVMREILLDADQAVLRFDLTLVNSGNGPARDLAIEAVALNGGDGQAQEIENFFARPAAPTVAVAELNPLGATTVSHELRMPRAAIRAYEAQGRALFVPVVAFNASYRTAAGEGRTGAAFLVGRSLPQSDKLGPLRLVDGADRLLGLGVRRLEERVRR